MSRRIRCARWTCWYCNPEPPLAVLGTVIVALVAVVVAWRFR